MPTDSSARSRRAVLALAAGLGAPLAACGAGAGAAPPVFGGYERVDLAPDDDPEPSPARVLVDLQPALEPQLWSASAGHARFTDPVGSLASNFWLESAGPGDLVAVRAGHLDVAGATGVRLSVLAVRRGWLGLTLLREGAKIASTELVEVLPSDELQFVVARFPRPLEPETRPDALELRFQTVRSPVLVRRVSILAESPSARAAVQEETELVVVGGEARRGWLASSHRALVGTARVRPGARLLFSWAQTASLRTPGSGGRLSVVTTHPGGRTSEQTIGLDTAEAGTTWREEELELDFPEGVPKAGVELALRFSVECAQGVDSACAIADVGVASESPDRPAPVLLVTSDTHRGDFIGAAARPAGVSTPNLDRLADRGVTFQDCFSATNITNPSHIALMTGSSPRDHGVRDNRTRLAEGAPTLAECFRDLGYRTWAAVSSRHLRDDVSGLGQGFDRMALPHLSDTRRAGDTLDVVEAWLASPGPPAVFLWVHLFDAHAPYEPPAEHAAPYWPSGMDPRDPSLPDPGLPESMLAPAKLQGLRNLDYPLACYKGEVSYLDAELGRLLDHAPFGEGDAGIVAFVADHGESLGEHRIYYGHNGLYPQTIQVPLILAWSDGPRGVRRADPVQQIDLSRTLLDLAGAEGVPFRGRSLVAGASSPAGDEAPRPRFALSANGLDASVTDGGRHFVLHLQSHHESAELDKALRHAFRLYDLELDPECQNDLAATEPEVARSLHATLVAWLQASEDLGWTGSSSEDPELAADLAELGYADPEEPAGPALWVADDCEWCSRVR